jgi:ankyrin repeat protein
MHGAGFQGRAKIAKLLIEHGIPMSDMHSDGYTPLHRACWGKEKRHTSTVKALLNAGVDPNEKSRDGKICSEMTQNKATLKLLNEWSAKKTAGEDSKAAPIPDEI